MAATSDNTIIGHRDPHSLLRAEIWEGVERRRFSLQSLAVHFSVQVLTSENHFSSLISASSPHPLPTYMCSHCIGIDSSSTKIIFVYALACDKF